MKVKLVFLPALVKPNRFEHLEVPPLGIYLLATIGKMKGYDVSLIDPCEFLKFNRNKNIITNSIKYLIQRLDDATVVGFSCNSFNWSTTNIAIEHIRKYKPNIKIVLGGLHPSAFDEYILLNKDVDFILRGDGERSFVRLLDAIAGKIGYDEVEGLSYRKNGDIARNIESKAFTVDELSQVPFPDYTMLPQDNPYIQIPIESSRGCPFCCSFCSIPHRKNWRGLEPEVVLKKIENSIEIKNNFNFYEYFLFVDDCFTIDETRTVEIFRLIEEKYGEKKKFFLEVRVSNILSKKIFTQININLISGMQIGVECGYDYGLEIINKKITIAQLYKALEIMAEQKCDDKCSLSFIIGFPWESKREIFMTLRTIEEIGHRFNVLCNINWLYYLPSTLWKNRKQYDIMVNESIFDKPLWINSKEVFFRVHPKVTISLLNEVNEWYKDIKKNIPGILYNMPVFYE